MIVTTQLLAREIVNAMLAFVAMSVAGLTIYRLVHEWRHSHWSDFFRIPVVRSCIAIVVLFTAEAVQRFWVFMLIRRTIHGQSTAWMEAHYYVPLAASILVTTGALCLIRVLAPVGTGRRAVTFVVVGCVIFLLIAL